MKLYRLACIVHWPEKYGEGQYMAEVPALPGCHQRYLRDLGISREDFEKA